MKLRTNYFDLIEDKKAFEQELDHLRDFKDEGDSEIKWLKATINHLDKLIDTYEYFANEN